MDFSVPRQWCIEGRGAGSAPPPLEIACSLLKEAAFWKKYKQKKLESRLTSFSSGAPPEEKSWIHPCPISRTHVLDNLHLRLISTSIIIILIIIVKSILQRHRINQDFLHALLEFFFWKTFVELITSCLISQQGNKTSTPCHGAKELIYSAEVRSFLENTSSSHHWEKETKKAGKSAPHKIWKRHEPSCAADCRWSPLSRAVSKNTGPKLD